ncbi:MAG: FIST C-terminal domain-containing protein [Gammaproteobacteria bacterium]|nr:FIST C-terminal domain-containing protein [Gammaproteobacteria bacterium]
MQDTIIKVGSSIVGDAYEAGRDAAKGAVDQLSGAKSTFALVFATVGYDQDKLLKGIVDVVGKIPVSGCSGEGIITLGGSDEGSAVVAVMLFSGDEIVPHAVFAQGVKKDSYKCGQEMAREVNKLCKLHDCRGADKPILILLPDGINTNVTQILGALESDLELPLTILGGTAGDMLQFAKTYQYHDGKAYTDSVAAVLLTGKYQVDFLVSHGCEAISLEKIVTKSNKNGVEEFDGVNAVEIIREYLSIDDPDEFNTEDGLHVCIGELHHLGKACGDQLIIRMPMALDKKTGTVQFSAEIPEGTRVYLTRRDPDAIAAKALEAVAALNKRNAGKEPLAVLQFDCVGRGRLIFGANLNSKIIGPIQEAFPATIPWIGFHTYGEFAPLCGRAFYHNFTVVLGVIYKK